MKITINQKATERFSKGHPWIFRSDLAEVEGKNEAGIAQVFNHKKKLLGEALYSPQSLIALRMMTEGSEAINSKLIHTRIENCLELREAIFSQSRTYRLVYGEADRLPSLIIDRYEDVLAFQTLSAGMEIFKETIVASLKKLFRPRSIVERNDALVRRKEGLELIRQVVAGEDPRELVIEIGGIKFGFNPLEGQKTGFFLDQRLNALAAARYLRGEVLDAFCYVGQFALHAASHAQAVECVDSSAASIEQVGRNCALNGLQNVQGLEANVFDYLKDCDTKKRSFDGICLDPPAFVKGRSALPTAIRGYKEINLRAMRLLKPGGILVTSSCSQNLSTEAFEKILLEAGKDAKYRLQILEKRTQPADHPWLLTMPETQYLKCYIVRVE